MRASTDTARRGRLIAGRLLTWVLVAALLTGMSPEVALGKTWLQRIGELPGRVLRAPNRVATWATKRLPGALGPIAAIVITRRITGNADIARILNHARKAERVIEDVRFIDQSAKTLRTAYADEATAARRDADEIARSLEQLKADVSAGRESMREGDVREIIDQRRLERAMRVYADQMDLRASRVGRADVIRLIRREIPDRLLRGAKDVVRTEVGNEVRRLVDRDVLDVLLTGGITGEAALQRILEHGTDRVLTESGEKVDADFRERLRDALRDRLKQDRDFFKKNWRAEVERLVREVKAQVARDRPAQDEEATGAPSTAPPDQAAPEQWVVWRAVEVGYKPIRIDTVEEFERPWPGVDFPGGGTSADPIKKEQIGGPFGTVDEARAWLDGVLGEPYRLSGIYAGMYVADYEGEPHNIESIGFDPAAYP